MQCILNFFVPLTQSFKLQYITLFRKIILRLYNTLIVGPEFTTLAHSVVAQTGPRILFLFYAHKMSTKSTMIVMNYALPNIL